MDPLSISAGVAGFTSLGLTVSNGLIQYCKKYRSRDSDLSQLKHHAEQLETFIALIRTRTSEPNGSSKDVDNPLQRCIDACNACLRHFKLLNAKYAHPKPSKDFLRRLKYPFDKEEFDNLRSQLKEFYAMLLGHLQLIHLDATQDIRGVMISEFAKVSLAVESLGRQLQSSISSAEHTTNDTIRNGLERMGSSFQQDLRETRNDLTISVVGHMHSLSDQLREGQGNQTSSIVDHMDQRFHTLENLIQTLSKNSGIGDKRKVVKPNTSYYDQGHNFTGTMSSRTHKEDLLGCLCQCPRIRQRGACVQHQKGCMLSFSNRKKRSWAMKFRVFQREVTSIWELEYSRIAWARDFRINRNLTVRAIVPNNSPAFKLITDIWEGAWTTKEMTTYDLGTSLRKCLIKLQELFRDGLAWPTDVDVFGRNLLNAANKFFISQPSGWQMVDEKYMLILEFMMALLEMGVPINDVSHYGITDTPLGECCHSTRLFTTHNHIGSIIISNFINRDATLIRVHWGIIIAILSCPIPGLYEPLACTEFLTYILRRSEDDVARLLDADNSVLYERTKTGQTPLHLAANWTMGLNILFEFGGRAIQSIINIKDKFRRSALDYAIDLGDVDSVSILTDAGASINPGTLYRLENVPQSKDIKSMIIAHSLARQRRELVQLAFLNLPSKMIEEFGLKEGDVVDNEAFDVAEALRQRGVALPTYYDYLTPTCSSIYHWEGMTASVAQNLFDAGFRKPNTKVCGYDPLMLLDGFYSVTNCLMLIEWFERHGLDLHEPIPTADCALEIENDGLHSIYRTIHVLGSRLGWMMEANYILRYDIKLPQLARLLEDDVTDPCLCYCTTNGCTVASKYFKEHRNYEKNKGRINVKLKLAGPAVSGRDGHRVALDLIRALTFGFLDMTHTCCCVRTFFSLESAICGGNIVYLKDREEIDEIREEERYLAEMLEALVEEFSMKFQEMNVPLDQFVEEYLWPRIVEVMKQKDQLSVEELDRMREIGVVLNES
ncbi:uncharacterized protein F4807DRAFT_427040 [Annulohypoxylon truncatum]|uniref:uncharacterized protein n=1 Tax=Annulohypoxylon truncatum TaxID=327061 RepID=UPI002008154C|nr:uncharacterized protein F4807DRAFT_427040 [Annulohypoxylon truncatum]KAI1209534.1 hypothetical protein F4807DRAFT_427040 [Annulohypoxylon truncatum]